MTRLYALYGAAVLMLLGVTQWRGWSLTSATSSQTNPRSVRANPGAYRSLYYIPGRTMRGK
jgi:threonine/homoserine/homoserine lactone efflux protein